MTSSKSPEQRMLADMKKAGRDREALAAVRDYKAEGARVDANTARLRAMRLEKEAAEAEKPVAAPAPKKKAASKAAAPRVRSRSKTEA